MAMRWLRSRLFHHVARKELLTDLFRGASCDSLPVSKSIWGRYTNLTRGIQMQSEASIQGGKAADNAEDCNAESCSCTTEALPDSKPDSQNAPSYTAMSNLKVSARHDLAMIFTCKVCETRSVKTCCSESYEKGVVVVRCVGCNKLHLIADRLGWFGEPGSIADLLAARGDVVKRGPIDSFNLTLDDLAGKKL